MTRPPHTAGTGEVGAGQGREPSAPVCRLGNSTVLSADSRLIRRTPQ